MPSAARCLDQVGMYPEDFYGMEEYDLACRILDKGYAIQYNDHRDAPQGIPWGANRQRKSSG